MSPPDSSMATSIRLQAEATQNLRLRVDHALKQVCQEWQQLWGADVLPLFEVTVTRQIAYGGFSKNIRTSMHNVQLVEASLEHPLQLSKHDQSDS